MQVKVNPIIILGMHRSGTSIVTKVLRNLGLFTGVWRDGNDESWFFMALNRFVMAKSKANWEYPNNFLDAISYPDFRERAIDYLEYYASTPLVSSYLGFIKYIKYRSLSSMDIPWAWKDPRNCYTLPLWKEIFPDARVLYISRHGLDVAKSLSVRAERHIETINKTRQQHRIYYRVRSLYGAYGAHSNVINIERGLKLWDEYMAAGESALNDFPAENVMRIKYEQFLTEPQEHIEAIAKFAGLRHDEKVVSEQAALINPSRSYAYRSDPVLAELSEKYADLLSKHGY